MSEGCAGHVTTHGHPTRPGDTLVARDHLPTRPAHGVFCCLPGQLVKCWIPPGPKARWHPLWAWQAHLSAHPRDDSKPRHSFHRGEVSWTPRILLERRTLPRQRAGRRAAVHPQPQGPSGRGATGNPTPGSNRVSETGQRAV